VLFLRHRPNNGHEPAILGEADRIRLLGRGVALVKDACPDAGAAGAGGGFGSRENRFVGLRALGTGPPIRSYPLRALLLRRCRLKLALREGGLGCVLSPVRSLTLFRQLCSDGARDVESARHNRHVVRGRACSGQIAASMPIPGDTMQVSPHLSFRGECEDAFKFYERTLGGRVVTMLKYGSSPVAEQVPLEWRSKIVHATMTVRETMLTGGRRSS